MQETFIDTRSCLDEEGLLHTFRYFLLTHQLPIGKFYMEDYGVRVEEVGVGSTQICRVTHSRPRIEELLALLLRHAVTPVNLFEVVEDWAKEKRLPYPAQQAVNA